MCCSMTQLSVNFIKTSANAVRTKLSWTRSRHLPSWPWFLGTTIKWSSRGCCLGFRCLVRYHSLRPRAHPLTQHGGSPFRASNGRDVCVSPTAGTRLCCQHNSPNHSFRQLRWCTLHLYQRNLVFVSINSVPQQQFACSAARTLVCRI